MLVSAVGVILTPSDKQRQALGEEVFTASRLLHAGRGQLQRLDAANDFYHLPLLTLAGGFERLMKVALCLDEYSKTGAFPPRKRLMAFGHNLEGLLARLRKNCQPPGPDGADSTAVVDWRYLASEDFLKFLLILNRFAQSDRYYWLDIVGGAQPSAQPPEWEWEKLESLAHPEWRQELIDSPGSSEVYERIAKEMVERLERFARALARLFTLGNLGKEGERLYGYVSSFAMLTDQDLGTRKYDPTGTLL